MAEFSFSWTINNVRILVENQKPWYQFLLDPEVMTDCQHDSQWDTEEVVILLSL